MQLFMLLKISPQQHISQINLLPINLTLKKRLFNQIKHILIRWYRIQQKTREFTFNTRYVERMNCLLISYTIRKSTFPGEMV